MPWHLIRTHVFYTERARMRASAKPVEVGDSGAVNLSLVWRVKNTRFMLCRSSSSYVILIPAERSYFIRDLFCSFWRKNHAISWYIMGWNYFWRRITILYLQIWLHLAANFLDLWVREVCKWEVLLHMWPLRYQETQWSAIISEGEFLVFLWCICNLTDSFT